MEYSIINYIDIDTNLSGKIGITSGNYQQNGNDWSTIKTIDCPSPGEDPHSKATGEEEKVTKGGKRRRRTRQARRRKNRRTRSR